MPIMIIKIINRLYRDFTHHHTIFLYINNNDIGIQLIKENTDYNSKKGPKHN